MFADYFFLLRASYSKLLGCKTVGYFFFSKLVWHSVRIALEPREPSFHSRLFLTETQSYIDRGRHLEKPRKRLREEGRERGEGAGRREDEIFFVFFPPLPSPSCILYPSTSPLITVFDSSQLSGSINVQDGGKTSFLKKKSHGSRCRIRLLCRLRKPREPHTPMPMGVQSCSLFSASLMTLRLTVRAYVNTQKYGLFCSRKTLNSNYG